MNAGTFAIRHQLKLPVGASQDGGRAEAQPEQIRTPKQSHRHPSIFK